MLVVIGLVLLFVCYSAVEYAVHRYHLVRIPVRVQVNGTRGKSSVTRLIAAGLRAGGIRTVAKVTGTRPRFILGDMEERPIRRLGTPNIAEEMRIIRLAHRHGARALVIECMALLPYYQWVERAMLIRPTHGVITNVRADHLDVMGPTVRDVGLALSNTIPRGGHFFTAERGPQLEVLRSQVHPDTEMTVTDPATVSDEEMKGFSYIEHPENVALALAVCGSLGVERAVALAGMYRTNPDPGVMKVYDIVDAGKRLEVVNTMAANDPDSIAMLWSMMKNRKQERIVIVNCRRDRTDRSLQLAELVARWEADVFVGTGGMPRVFLQKMAECGAARGKLVDLGEDLTPELVYERLLDIVRQDALLFFTGNTVGYGEELIGFFATKAAVIGS